MEGVIDHVFVIASDVTDQVLARNQLNDLREAAESANRTKDEFLAMRSMTMRSRSELPLPRSFMSCSAVRIGESGLRSSCPSQPESAASANARQLAGIGYM